MILLNKFAAGTVVVLLAAANTASAQGLRGDLTLWGGSTNETGTGDADDGSDEKFTAIGAAGRMAYDFGSYTAQIDLSGWEDQLDDGPADDDQHKSSYQFGVHVDRALASGMRIGLIAGGGKIMVHDDDDGTFYFGGVEAQQSFGSFTINGQIGAGDAKTDTEPRSDYKHLNRFIFANVSGEYDFSNNMSLIGRLGYAKGDVEDDAVSFLTYGLEFNYDFASVPLDAYIGVSGISGSQDDTSSTLSHTRAYIGLRYAFGGSGKALMPTNDLNRLVGAGFRFD